MTKKNKFENWLPKSHLKKNQDCWFSINILIIIVGKSNRSAFDFFIIEVIQVQEKTGINNSESNFFDRKVTVFFLSLFIFASLFSIFVQSN